MSRIVPQILTETARQYPTRTAITRDEKAISYQELEALSNRMAHALRANGVERGDRVGMFLDKSIEAVASLIAIMKADGICVPLDPPGPVPRLSDQITTILLADDRPMEFAGHPVTVLPWSMVQAAPETLPETATIDVDLAYILYTSGSTGTPKGVMITHRNVSSFVDWVTRHFGFVPEDQVSCHAPLHFDVTLIDLYASLAVGATVHLIPQDISFMPVDLVDFINKKAITVWQSVPSVLVLIVKQLVADAGPHLESLRCVIFTGEVFPPLSLRDLMTKVPHPAYYNIYGSTEMNDVTCLTVTRAPDTEILPIGKPCSHMEVFALDDDGKRITQAGVVGELYARGATLSAGYWGDPAMTAAKFMQNPLHQLYHDPVYRTGDLVMFDAEGYYRYVGRRDSQVKIRGFRVNLIEVEDAIARHPHVDEVAVVDLEDDKRSRYLKAFVVPKNGHAFDSKILKQHCATRLPNYMVPEELELRSVLPKTSTGKVDRKILKQPGA
jgi:amino acid adenylation domain-containing protein